MFGVTTPSSDRVVDQLQDGFECFVFHATGVGGQTMENWSTAASRGVIDVTTTEVADLLWAA